MAESSIDMIKGPRTFSNITKQRPAIKDIIREIQFSVVTEGLSRIGSWAIMVVHLKFLSFAHLKVPFVVHW